MESDRRLRRELPPSPMGVCLPKEVGQAAWLATCQATCSVSSCRLSRLLVLQQQQLQQRCHHHHQDSHQQCRQHRLQLLQIRC